MGSDALEVLNERMLKRLLDINPDAGTVIGLHDPYDFHLPHGGLRRLTDSRDLLVEWLSEARKLAEKEPLAPDQNISLKLLQSGIDALSFGIDEHKIWSMYPDVVETVGSLCFIMFSRDYAPAETRAKAVASRLHQVPRFLEEFRDRFQGAKPVKLWTEIAVDSCDQVPAFLHFINSSWKANVSAETASELNEGVQVAVDAIGVQKRWLEGLMKDATPDFAMGPDKFEKMLRVRGLGMNADEILRLGEKYLKDLKAEREVVAARISEGRGLEEAKRIVEEDGPGTFEEGLESTKREMEKARAYIAENGIATIDDKAVLKVVETPDFLRQMLPYAALFMSSKFDPVQEGMYVVTRPEDPKDLGSHLNYASIINTAVHEAYPGHFHQGVCSNKRHWLLQLYNVIGGTEVPAMAAETVEGWAHYCEKMMFDRGYEATDPSALAMLDGAIWRAYRIIADIKLARGEATLEEMVDLAVKEVGMPRAAALSEAKRYTFTPGQALSYLLGRHLIIEFRKDLERQLGDRFDEKRFHDLVAGYGYLPISLMEEAVRKSMA